MTHSIHETNYERLNEEFRREAERHFLRRLDDPLSRIPFREMLDFAQHWGDGHERAGCQDCSRFAWVLIAAGAIVVDPETLTGTLHPQVQALIAAAGSTDGDRPQQTTRRRFPAHTEHTDHIHISMGTTPPVEPDTSEVAAAAPAARPTGDVLDTVADDGSLLCACGCKVRITDASPSAYYASAGCQFRVMQGYATDPQEVYSRLDAHLLVEADVAEARAQAAAAPTVHSSLGPFLNRGLQHLYGVSRSTGMPRQTEWAVPAEVAEAAALEWTSALRNSITPRALVEHDPGGTVQVIVAPAPHGSLLDYTRRCRTCSAERAPWTSAGPVDAGTRIGLEMVNPLRGHVGRRWVRQQCGDCRSILPGRVYFGRTQPHPTQPMTWRLILEDGVSEAARNLDISALGPDLDRARSQQLVFNAGADVWRRLEKRLDRFADDWRSNGQLASTPLPAGHSDSPYLIDVPPSPLWRGRRT